METWTGISYSHIRELDRVTIGTIIKKLIKTPDSTPTLGIYAKAGILPAEESIKKKRLRFLHRLMSGSEKKLAKQVYEVQKVFRTPKRMGSGNENNFRKI